MAVKPNLALIPSGVGTDTLYSVLPADGTGDFTFDRNLNTATRINKDGLIEMVDADVPRLNYPLIDGVVSGCPSLLLEPQRTNIIPYSEAFDNAVWQKNQSSITPNATISPDGTLNASKLIEDNTSNFHRIIEEVDLVSSDYSHTVFAKASERKYFVLRNNINGTNVNACFDLENGAVVYSGFDEANIEYYGNGWYRCFIKETSTSTSPRSFSLITSDKEVLNNNIPSYQGDGTSGLYIWSAQLEAGSYPTSYIPTNGEVNGVTRSAETCNNAGDANTFNDSEGVLMAEISAFAETGRISLNDGTTNNNVRLVYDATNVIYAILFNGTNQTFLTYTLPIEGGFNKIAFKYKASDFALWVDGIEVDSQVGSGTTFTSGTLSEIDFDAGSNGLVPFYGSTKQLQYFDTALTDTDLEELTSWQSFNEMAESQQYTIQ